MKRLIVAVALASVSLSVFAADKKPEPSQACESVSTQTKDTDSKTAAQYGKEYGCEANKLLKQGKDVVNKTFPKALDEAKDFVDSFLNEVNK